MSDRPVRSRIRVRAGQGAPPTVDGHPGWVQKSVAHYASVVALCTAAQGFIAGTGEVMSGARAAAWWCVALGGACGLLIWTPVWGLTRANKARTLDEAFQQTAGRTLGSALTIFYTLLAVLDGLIALDAVVSVVRQYLLPRSSEMYIGASAVLILSLSVYRHGSKGMSLLVYRSRISLVFVLLLCAGFLLRNTDADNLFPLLGNNPADTFRQIPVAAGAFSCAAALGLLPRQTGSAKNIRYRTGLYALLAGLAVAAGLTLLCNLSMPPRTIASAHAYGRQMLAAAEFTEHRTIRFLYLATILSGLVLSLGASIATADMFLHGIAKKKAKWPVIAVGAVAALSSALVSQPFADMITLLARHRFALAAAPVWILWGVSALLQRREGKAAQT